MKTLSLLHKHRYRILLILLTIATILAILSDVVSLATYQRLMQRPVMQKPIHWTIITVSSTPQGTTPPPHYP